MTDQRQSGETRDDARLTISEATLRSISFALIEGHAADGSILWLVEGTYPNGHHAMFLALPYDVVQIDGIGQ